MTTVQLSPVVRRVTLTRPVTRVTLSHRGQAGAPGESAEIVLLEVPSGSVNGSNVTFTAAYDFVPETVTVHVNGLLQATPADYVTSGVRPVAHQLRDQLVHGWRDVVRILGAAMTGIGTAIIAPQEWYTAADAGHLSGLPDDIEAVATVTFLLLWFSGGFYCG